MKANQSRTNPEAAHTVEAVFATFPTCAQPFPNRKAAATRAETLARETAGRLFTELDTCLNQPIARVHPPVPPRKPAGRNLPPPPTAEEVREAAWRKRLYETAWAWTERTDCRPGTALKISEGQAWLPVAALELACLEGYAVREVQPIIGAGEVFPSCSEQKVSPRADFSTPQPQPSTPHPVYA